MFYPTLEKIMPTLIIVMLLRNYGFPEMDSTTYLATKQFKLPANLYDVFCDEFNIYNAEVGNNCADFDEWLSDQDKLVFD